MIDSREQLPYSLEPMQTVCEGLQTGDYSVRGLESLAALERKALADFVACCGVERDRFVRELHRLRGYRYRAIVLEASYADCSAGEWRSSVTPATVLSSIASWSAEFAPVILAGSRRGGEDFARRWLFTVARHECERLRSFAGALQEARTAALEAFLGAGAAG